MTVSRAQVLACARTFIGTRWQHQGRKKGLGIDCAGLVICVARELGLTDVDFANYSRHPDGASLIAACKTHMRPLWLGDAMPGDVLAMTFDLHPQHLAILSEFEGRQSLIHSYAEARMVVEHGLDSLWLGRVRGAFHIPGVE